MTVRRLKAFAFASALVLAGCADGSDSAIQVVQAPCNIPDAKRVTPGISYRMRYLRIQEENAIIQRTGSPEPLATGSCSVKLSVDPVGNIAGPLDINCEKPALVDDARKAVVSMAPFIVPQGFNHVGIIVDATDPEPGEDTQD